MIVTNKLIFVYQLWSYKSNRMLKYDKHLISFDSGYSLNFKIVEVIISFPNFKAIFIDTHFVGYINQIEGILLGACKFILLLLWVLTVSNIINITYC